MSVMRSTLADKCFNSFHSPAAANQATVSLLNYMTFVFDVQAQGSVQKKPSVDCGNCPEETPGRL